MNIRTLPTRTLNYLKNNKWTLTSKAAGLAAAGYVLYNANYSGKKDSDVYVKKHQSERMTKYYMYSRRLNERNNITSKLKDFVFRSNADWSLPDKINAVIGYTGGAFQQLTTDIIPATLAAGALVSKRFSTLFGAGLGVWALKYLAFDVLDVYRPDYLKSNDI